MSNNVFDLSVISLRPVHPYTLSKISFYLYSVFPKQPDCFPSRLSSKLYYKGKMSLSRGFRATDFLVSILSYRTRLKTISQVQISKRVYVAFFNPFQNKLFLRVCSTNILKNTVGKGAIAHNEQFLLFPQCFLPF